MSGGKTTTTSSNTVDPKMLALYTNQYNDAKAFADQPSQAYTGQLVAPMNDNQLQAGGLFKDIANNNTGADSLNQAKGIFGNLASYNPAQINAGSYTAANANAPEISAGLLRNTDLAPYLNPFTQNVIDTTIADQERARQIAGVSDNQAATAAKAFGGSRSGVLSALTNEAYDRNTGSLLANLRNEGYNNAQNAAIGDLNRGLSVDQFNAGNKFAANQFNANASNAASQFNINNSMNAQAQNAANDLSGAGIRSGAATSLANVSEQELQQALQRAFGIGAFGDAQQQNQQALDTANYSEFQRLLDDQYRRKALASGALSSIPLQQTQTQTQKSSPGLLGILGTGLSAASLFV